MILFSSSVSFCGGVSKNVDGGEWNTDLQQKLLSHEPCKCLDIFSIERHYPVVYTFYNSSFFPLTISFCLRKPDSFSSVVVKSSPGRSHYERWCTAKARRDEWTRLSHAQTRLTHFTSTAGLSAFTQRSDFKRLIRWRFTGDMFMEQSVMKKDTDDTP